MSKNDPTQVADKVRQTLTRASGQQMQRSALLRKLHLTAKVLDEALKLIAGEIETDEITTEGRPMKMLRLRTKPGADSTLEQIGRLIVEAVHLARGGAK